MKYQYYSQDPMFCVGNIDVQTVSRPKNYKHTFRNGREKNGFIYIENGSMTGFFRNSETSELHANKGDIVFIPKGSIYTGMYMEDETKIKIIQFDIVSGDLPSYLSAPVKIDLFFAQEIVEEFFYPIESHISYHPFHLLSCMYKLLWQIDESKSQLPKKCKKIQPALSKIWERWNQNDKISYYAELCSMSEASLRRLFREYTGKSPIEYRNDIRLTRAKSKLQSGEFNVSEVAYESGFDNLSFFTRLYKKKYGYTPKKE